MSQRPQFGTTSRHASSRHLSFAYFWTVQQFACLYESKNKWAWPLVSPHFSPPHNETLGFSLRLVPRVPGIEEFLGISLTPEKMIWQDKITVKWKASIIDERGRRLTSKDFYESGRVEALVSLRQLHHRFNGYLARGNLLLQIEIDLRHSEAIFTLPISTSRIFHHKASSPSSVSSLSSMISHLHRFTVENFKNLLAKEGACIPLSIESSFFALGGVGGFRVELQPKGEKVEMGVFNYSTRSSLVHYSVELLGPSGKVFHSDEGTTRLAPNSGTLTCLPLDHLLAHLQLPAQDRLTLTCHLDVLPEIPKEPHLSTPTSTSTISHLDLALFSYHPVSYTWLIEDPSQINPQNEYIQSPTFGPPTQPLHTFSTTYKLQYNLSLLEQTGETSYQTPTITCLLSQLPHQAATPLPLPNNTLTITCQLVLWESLAPTFPPLTPTSPSINLFNSTVINSVVNGGSMNTGDISSNNQTLPNNASS